MNLKKWAALAAALSVACCTGLAQQEKGEWRPASNSAKNTTGYVAFSAEKISINYASFTIAQIRDLTPTEIGAIFNLDTPPTASGNLYRLSIPETKTFLHKNTLCADEETDWVATYAEGHTLRLAFFSGLKIPDLTPEAIANATNICGTYAYVR
jgi:hypothetical protein